MRHAGSMLAFCHSAPDPQNLPSAMGARSPVRNVYTNTSAFWMTGVKMHEETGRISVKHHINVYMEILPLHQPKIKNKTSFCD